MRGHLSGVEIAFSVNQIVLLTLKCTCDEGTPVMNNLNIGTLFEVSPRHRFYCMSICGVLDENKQTNQTTSEYSNQVTPRSNLYSSGESGNLIILYQGIFREK